MPLQRSAVTIQNDFFSLDKMVFLIPWKAFQWNITCLVPLLIPFCLNGMDYSGSQLTGKKSRIKTKKKKKVN